MGAADSQPKNEETTGQNEDSVPITDSQDRNQEQIERITNRNHTPEDIEWRKEVFYKLHADGRFIFDGNQMIKVNKSILASKSEKFHEMFMKSRENAVRIQDYDIVTFRLFLDCLLGFEVLSEIDALLIFPIAWKYETKTFVRYCIRNVLKPVTLNENLCSTLNLGLICQCNELVQIVLNFLTERKLFYKLLDDEQLCKFLEPESMAKLLENVKIDSYLLKNILKWAKGYLEKNSKYNDLKSFLKDYKMIDKLTLSCFETSDSMLKFGRSKTGRNFFPANTFFAYVNRFGYLPGKSKWFKIKKGEKVTEKIVVKDVINIEKHEVELLIFKNPVVFYDHPKQDSDMMICTSVTYSYDGRKKKNKNDEEVFPETMETIYSDEKKKFVIKVEDLTNAVKDVELEIVFNFLFDCRILKMTPKNFIPKNEKEKDGLFFVNSVEIVRKMK